MVSVVALLHGEEEDYAIPRAVAYAPDRLRVPFFLECDGQKSLVKNKTFVYPHRNRKQNRASKLYSWLNSGNTMLYATRKLLNARHKMLYATRKLLYATRKLLYATRKLLNARHKILIARQKMLNARHKMLNARHKMLIARHKMLNASLGQVIFNLYADFPLLCARMNTLYWVVFKR